MSSKTNDANDKPPSYASIQNPISSPKSNSDTNKVNTTTTTTNGPSSSSLARARVDSDRDAVLKFTEEELNELAPNFDLLSIEGDQEKSTSQIKAEVLRPKKIGQGITAYAAYTIKSESTVRVYNKASSQVERRYSDFEWLRRQLLMNYQGIVILKLPEKIQVADPFDELFLEQRRKQFGDFLKHVCEHEELKLSKSLMQFLCDDQLEKQPWYAKVNASSALDGIGSMFSGALGSELLDDDFNSSSLGQLQIDGGVANDVATESSPSKQNNNGSSAASSAHSREDPDFASLSNYIRKLERELKVSVDVAEQVILSFYSLAMLSEAMGENATFLGDCEEKGAQMLLKSKSAGGLGKAFKKTGEAMKAMKEPMERRSKDLSQKFRHPLIWAKQLAASCKEAIEARAKCLYDVVQAKKRLEQAKQKLDNQLGGGTLILQSQSPAGAANTNNSDKSSTITPKKSDNSNTNIYTPTKQTPPEKSTPTEQLSSWFSSVTASLTAKPPTIYEMQQDVELKTNESRACEAKYEIVKRRTMVELPLAHERIEVVLNACFEDMTKVMKELAFVQVQEFEAIMPGSTKEQKTKDDLK
jgi:sorting nexin-1/2